MEPGRLQEVLDSEHILLTNLLTDAWGKGETLGLPDLVASGSADKTICVWDVSGRDQWSKQTTLRGHTVRNK